MEIILFEYFFQNLKGKHGIEAIDKLISPPLFPITRDMFSDNVSFHSFVPGETLTLGLHDTIETSLFPHPGQNCGYRLNRRDKNTLCYISDIENNSDSTLDDVIKFIKNCNHLIIDSSYTKEESKSRKGWGHLNLDDIEIIASRLPGVQIYLYHHDIFKTDSQIEMDSRKLLNEYNNVKLAKQLDVVELS